MIVRLEALTAEQISVLAHANDYMIPEDEATDIHFSHLNTYGQYVYNFTNSDNEPSQLYIWVELNKNGTFELKLDF